MGESRRDEIQGGMMSNIYLKEYVRDGTHRATRVTLFQCADVVEATPATAESPWAMFLATPSFGKPITMGRC